MFKHILIPTDGSKLSKEAAEAGVKLAQTLGARVSGFFAAPAPTPIIYKARLPVGYATLEEHRKMIEKTSAGFLAVIEKAARAADVPCEVISVTSDFPADAILAAAKKRRCDLIFIASNGRQGLRGVLLGSETRKVLTHSPVPVLVYRRRS